jgi:type II secretory pathway component GspD/PulD (secretin)
MLSKIPLLGEAFKSKSNKSVRTELVILLTPHIIEGDELITGYSRDFGHKLDKEYQQYRDLSEQTEILDYKPYQTYPKIEGDIEAIPGMKPARNF